MNLLSFFLNRIIIKGKNKVFFNKKKVKNYQLNLIGQNNVFIAQENFVVRNLDIKILGENNKITIGANAQINNLHIEIKGSNNNITLGNDILIADKLTIYNHCDTQNANITIGDKTSFYNTTIHNYDNDSSIAIGEDCMFAYNTLIYNTDGHSIFQDGQLINKAEKCKIGNHVWCAMDSSILKNSNIPDGCIVGKSAVVSGNFTQANVVLGGIPAKIIKKNIYWDRNTVNDILNKKLKNPLGGGKNTSRLCTIKRPIKSTQIKLAA